MLTWTESEISLNQMGAMQTLDHYQIIRRNGAVVPFEPEKIAVAVMKTFLDVYGTTRNLLQKSIFALLGKLGSWVVTYSSLNKRAVLMGFRYKIKTAQIVLCKSNGFFSSVKTNLRNAP